MWAYTSHSSRVAPIVFENMQHVVWHCLAKLRKLFSEEDSSGLQHMYDVPKPVYTVQYDWCLRRCLNYHCHLHCYTTITFNTDADFCQTKRRFSTSLKAIFSKTAGGATNCIYLQCFCLFVCFPHMDDNDDHMIITTIRFPMFWHTVVILQAEGCWFNSQLPMFTCTSSSGWHT